MTTFEKLIEIFKNIITDSKVDINSITPKTNIFEDLGLNSIGIMYMVLAIEDEFNILMHNSSIEKFKTVEDVIEYIEENQ
jgi:acyl carrier protein